MTSEVITALTLAQVPETKDQISPKQRIPTFHVLDYSVSWGYFDDASQGHPPSIGVGVVMFLNQNHYINIKYALGGGSNNKAELIALWTLLEAGKQKDVRKLHVLGDSKLVIDWAKGKISHPKHQLGQYYERH